MEISSSWTRFERAELIKKLTKEHYELSLPENAGGDPNSEKTKYKIFDLEERIRFIAVMPASFLEVNRDAILNGKLPIEFRS